MEGYQCRHATHIGRQHLLQLINRQDAHALYQGNLNQRPTIIGIVCDGCSEGRASEVGAGLASNFLISQTMNLLTEGVDPPAIPTILYQRLIGFLRQIVAGMGLPDTASQIDFIQHHLLFTVVGLVVTDQVALPFIAGDGTLVINDRVILRDEDNRPIYPAYHLIDRRRLTHLATALPQSFTTYEVERSGLQRFAIGSDAWHSEADLLDKIWNFQHPAGLQRQLNIWSKRDHRFADDVTVITLELTDQMKNEVEDESSDRGETSSTQPT